jgi:outer membrane receptor protein involved in Fe transport
MSKRTLLITCAAGAFSLTGAIAVAQVTAVPPTQAVAAAPTPAPSNASGTTIGELVVTAQRREENLQDTPVAVSAFSAQTLRNEKLEGGNDLLLQVPNSNFTRTNFGSFNFKIRGVGTDVIGSGGTQGVSINENELPVTANHFQDSDFFDVDRVEVLRGPQGTLYGRNATGGAVNLITTQPGSQFGGYGSVQYGNYNQLKVTGAVNIPIGDTLAVRIAGVRLVNDGFGENTYLNQRVDDRDLGAIRTTISFKPSDKFSAYLMYEHFGEDDTRNRVGKQLCIKDPGPSNVGGVPIAAAGGPVATNYAAFLNQGCIPGSLNQPAAYGTLNSNGTLAGTLANIGGISNGVDLFGANPLQDRNLHNIQSVIQPRYKAQEDLVDLHMAWNITDNLTLTSITGYNRDVDSSAEDYNRVVPNLPYTPVNTGLYNFNPLTGGAAAPGAGVGLAQLLFPGGVIHDPQTGTSNRVTSFDETTDDSKEYTEELRLTSSFKGPLNFSVGGFYSEITSPFSNGTNYYVESNALTGYAQVNNAAGLPAIAVDPNYPATGAGHNYYDSRTGGGYLKSYAGFAEVYYDIAPTLKLTLGGRYTVDQLYNIAYPILLEAPGTGFPTTYCAAGTTSATCLTQQHVTYREFTGRANLQWTPSVSFTDKTMFYATYSRGYKGGGFNTPCQEGAIGSSTGTCPYPATYNPEFINAYEVGTKNTLLGGSLQLNLTGFYYDYKGYQISEIVAESSVNLNINAKIYGAEFESVWSPVRHLTLNANVGAIHTAIDKNTYEIDQLNLNQGNAAYTLVKQTSGSNCLAPTAAVAGYIATGQPAYGLGTLCTPGTAAATAFGVTSNPNEFGIAANIGGNKLPNTPPVTVSVGAQYVFELPADWRATIRGDYYWQDDSFARIFNAVNDRLQSYHVVNATLTFANLGQGLDLQLFVKNALNAQPITGTYLTDATSGLFQNVFTLDPRTYGAQLTKRF